MAHVYPKGCAAPVAGCLLRTREGPPRLGDVALVTDLVPDDRLGIPGAAASEEGGMGFVSRRGQGGWSLEAIGGGTWSGVEGGGIPCADRRCLVLEALERHVADPRAGVVVQQIAIVDGRLTVVWVVR